VAVHGREAVTLKQPLGTAVPEGVVTFLLTDVEGSSRLWERDAEAMRAAISLHYEMVERAVNGTGGVRPVEQGEGDSVVVAFSHASEAVACALALQRGLQAAPWPPDFELRIRVALHSGEALLRGAGQYVGPALNRCARLRSVAHGGQTLLSRATYELVAESLPEGASLRSLGPLRLRDLARDEEVFELCHPDLPSDFPDPRALGVVANNLPVALSSFVGRERELAELSHLLDGERLLTLTGAGGCGKTRLALQAASEAPRAAAEVIAELRQKLSDSMARDNTMLEERSRILETLETLLSAVNHASTEQRSAIDALVGASAELMDRVGTRFNDKVEAETGKMAEVAAQITGSAVEVASLGEAFGFGVQLFSDSNDKLVTHLQRLEGALSKSIARSDEQLDYYVAQAREVIDLSITSQKQIVEDLQQLASNRSTAGSEA